MCSTELTAKLASQHNRQDTDSHTTLAAVFDSACLYGAVCSVDVQYKADSLANPSAAVSEMVPEWGRRLLDDAAVPLPPPASPSNR